jgi:hypothetical protein
MKRKGKGYEGEEKRKRVVRHLLQIIDGLVMNLAASVIVFATWPDGGGILDDVEPIPRCARLARMYHVNITVTEGHELSLRHCPCHTRSVRRASRIHTRPSREGCSNLEHDATQWPVQLNIPCSVSYRDK